MSEVESTRWFSPASLSGRSVEWQRVKLGDVCSIVAKQVDPKLAPFKDLPHINGENIESGTGRLLHLNTADEDGMTSGKYLFEPGDVLYSKLRPYLRKVVVVEFGGVCSADMYPIRVDPLQLDSKYAGLLLLSEGFTNYAVEESRRARMPKLNREQLFAWDVLIPPVFEQQRIAGHLAEQLHAIECARTAAEVRASAARSLPTAYLRSVFNVPDNGGWSRARLGEVCDLRPSKSIATDGDTVVSAITTACLSESGFLSAGLKSARMWAGDAVECVVEIGEILVARSNTAELVGRAALFNGEAEGVVASDLTIRIWPGPRCHPPFLAGYLSYLYQTGYWIDRAGGASGSMKKITRSQIVELEIPLPPLDDQRAISYRLSGQMETVGILRKSLDHELAAINKLPDAILGQAFAGRI